MSEEQQEQQQEQQQAAERPEYVPEKFWNNETKEVRLEDAFKSYTHLEQKMSGKAQAPETYELGFSSDFDKTMLEGLDAETPLIANLIEIAGKSDLSQDGFNGILNAIVGSELEQIAAVEEIKKQEMALLGDHGPQRIKDMQLWLDATLPEDEAAALKGLMNSAKAIEALEIIKKSTQKPGLNPGDDDLDNDDVQSHEELRKRQFATDENGNRLMSNPAYRKQWQADAAAANFRA